MRIYICVLYIYIDVLYIYICVCDPLHEARKVRPGIETKINSVVIYNVWVFVRHFTLIQNLSCGINDDVSYWRMFRLKNMTCKFWLFIISIVRRNPRQTGQSLQHETRLIIGLHPTNQRRLSLAGCKLRISPVKCQTQNKLWGKPRWD